MRAHLRRLIDHMAWADDQVLSALRGDPPQEAVRLFAHLVTAEQIYAERIRAEDPWPQDFWPALTVGQCARLLPDLQVQYRAILEVQPERALHQPVRYRNSKGTVYHTPVSEMLTHVALHGEHHRGQIARVLRHNGRMPPVTDYITYTRLRS